MAEKVEEFWGTRRRGGLLTNIYPGRLAAGLCGDDVVPVTVRRAEEGEEPTHWAWRKSSGALCHFHGAPFLVEMCAPDGFRAAIEAGEGQLVAVIVELDPGRAQ